MLEAVVTRARESGDTFSLPMALSYLGMDYAHCEDDELGFAYLDEALAITRRLGPLREEQLAMALWMKAITLLTKQDPAARPVLEELMTLGIKRGYTDRNAATSAGLAMVDALDGDLESAEAHLTAALAVLPGNARPTNSSFVHLVAAMVARAQRDLNAAEDSAQQALLLDAGAAEDPGFSWRIEILETLAGILIRSGEARDGVRLLAATDAGRIRHLRPRPQSLNKDLERDLAAARELLGNAETDTAWADGLEMTIDDAVAFARGRGPHRRRTTG
jgi:tetratricopeptide (TPR) repeat protein